VGSCRRSMAARAHPDAAPDTPPAEIK